MNKKWLLLGLCLVFIIATGFLYDRYAPPLWIEQTTDDEDWAFRVSEPGSGMRGSDSSAGVVYEILPDGTLVIYDTSGNTTFAIEASSGNALTNPGRREYSPSISGSTSSSGLTGFQLSVANIRDYGVFKIDALVTGYNPSHTANGDDCLGPEDGTGVTVVLPTPTAAIDGKEFMILNVRGTTDVFLWANNLPISGVSTTDVDDGVTCFTVNDQVGDYTLVRADYDSSVSYWVIDYWNR